MAASKVLLPLSSQVEIVDDNGKPTPQFCRLLQKLAIGNSLTQTTSGTLELATIAAKTILANKTAGSATATACTISDILDFITGTPARGDILFRGATTWQRLPADTAGKVLQTNGAGADPTWVTPAAGGGGGTALWDWGFAGTGGPGSVSGSTTATLGAGAVTTGMTKASIGNWWWFNSGQSSKSVTFDLGSACVVSGITMFQDIAAAQGTWQAQYSDDNVTYTNIGSAVAWNAVFNTWAFTNSTAHRYWRLNQTSGTTNNASWQQGTMFRWGAA